MNVSEHFNASVKNSIMKFTFQFFTLTARVNQSIHYNNCSILVSYFNDLLRALSTVKTENC